MDNKFIEKYFKKYSYDLDKIVGINPFDFNDLYILENGVLGKISHKEIKNEHLLSTYIPSKNVITYELKVPKNILEKVELEDYIETKAYEEIGLDEAEEYIFKHKEIENANDEKNIAIELVIISTKELKDYFEEVKSKFKFLDFITYPGYVFSVLYQKEILEPQTDLYIYFSKEEIFITLYSEGKFLQTSTIPEGLDNLYEAFLKEEKDKDEENFSFDDFLKLLVSQGLEASNYSETETSAFNSLSEIFSNKFLIISNQIHSIVRKFGLPTLDRIFMSTIKGNIPGISEFANMYLGIESKDLKFDMNYNPDEIEIDQILFLSMLYAQYSYENDYQEDNFTIFYRPPTFFYRRSGQLIAISVASILLSIAYPMYQMAETYFVNNENNQLQSKLSQLESKNSKLKRENKKLVNLVKKVTTQKDNLMSYISNIEQVIQKIYIEKNSYIPKSKFLANLSHYLHNNKVYVKTITFSSGEVKTQTKQTNKTRKTKKAQTQNFNKTGFLLNVYSRKDAYITNFINDLVTKEHLIVSTNGYKNENGFYTSQIFIKVEK